MLLEIRRGKSTEAAGRTQIIVLQRQEAASFEKGSHFVALGYHGQILPVAYRVVHEQAVEVVQVMW